MDNFRLIEFQTDRLGYHFKDIDLLQEALTHSLDSLDLLQNFPNQNRSYNRLQIIGNAVLKFTISQFVVQTLQVTANEGKFTARKDSIINGTVQKKVGARLFEPYTSPKTNIWNYLRAGKSFKLNYNQNQAIPYEKIVRALMGAVYLDAGGISGSGMEATTKLFMRIWGDYLDSKRNCGSLHASFPAPSDTVRKFWADKGVGRKFIATVENSIGVNVNRGHLLAEALIQKTFYDGISVGHGDHLPDYQRLEFLGDSVLGLVIAEVLWKQYLFDQPGSIPLDHKITALIEAKAQLKIFQKLGLQKFVKMKAGGIQGWSMNDDIVESIVGAIFVDGGRIAAKKFILKTWNLKETIAEIGLEDIQDKLGYKFQNDELLLTALISARSGMYSTRQREREGKLREVMTYFGKLWIRFHATEYTLRTLDLKDSLDHLADIRDHLCGGNVLFQITKHLNLSEVSSPDDIVETIAGAIFLDMQKAKVQMSFGKVFYRLWNQFLDKCPNENLLENFPKSHGSSLLSQYEVAEMEEHSRHSFSHEHLLQQIIPPTGLNRTSGRLSFLGESLLDLAVGVHATIWSETQLSSSKIDPDDVDAHELHAHILSKCMDFGEDLYRPWTLRESIETRVDALGLKVSKVSNEEIVKRILGAVYVDMSRNSADMTFSEWTKYFKTRCEFITSKERGELIQRNVSIYFLWH